MADGTSDAFIENRTFDELAVGDSASISHVVTQRDIDLFATVTGDVNPAHVYPAYAATDMFHHVIIQGMWGAGLISATLGTRLPGPGTIYLGQDLRFVYPVSIGDTVTATVTVREKKPPKGDVVLDCLCANQDGKAVITGSAFVRAPHEKVRVRRVTLPDVRVERHDRNVAMIARAAAGGALRTAVVYPDDAVTLHAAVDAAKAGLIVPVLLGPEARMQQVARDTGVDLGGVTLIDVAGHAEAAARAVALARSGDVGLLMKGNLHTADLMHAVVAADTGLRTARRISHVYLMDVPDYPRPLLITDAAINITPDLMDKAAIVQNAIDLAHVIGVPRPRVAILAAVETINDRMRSTLDAAALCKMADRGQITGGILDGPLAFDNAINEAAAAEKGIVSDVAGRADILLVPDLEAGNMLAKQLTFMAGAEAAGLVLGARVPVILTSRADSAGTRLASCALGVLAARAAA
ncbi:MAG TPA: bifunctional enoyl-CoA hydratase/phosphate acetyltransferase [Rhodopila sp.]